MLTIISWEVGERDLLSIMNDLATIPGVQVDRVAPVEPFYVPDDASFAQQWHLSSFPGVNASEARDQVSDVDLSNVKVAIIDTGFDKTHVDLKFANVPNTADSSHGSHVAGLVGATTDNSH